VRIKELGGLGGIAVLAVIDCHYLAWLPTAGEKYQLLLAHCLTTQPK
jgi:hypothetical protein